MTAERPTIPQVFAALLTLVADPPIHFSDIMDGALDRFEE
jgi:hypothetical protein